MKKIIARVKINEANTTGMRTVMFANGSNETALDEQKRAVKFLNECGITVKDAGDETHNTSGLTVIIDNKIHDMGLRAISLTEIAMNSKSLLMLYNKLDKLGHIGIEIVSAIASAYQLIYDDEFDALTWVNVKTTQRMGAFLFGYFERILETACLTDKDVKTIFTVLGGYAGCRALVVEALRVTAAYIRSGNAPNYMEAYKNKCLTCKNCDWDENSNRFCKKCAVRISDDMTVGEVNKFYIEATIIDGAMYSNFTPFGVERCEHYDRRH